MNKKRKKRQIYLQESHPAELPTESTEATDITWDSMDPVPTKHHQPKGAYQEDNLVSLEDQYSSHFFRLPVSPSHLQAGSPENEESARFWDWKLSMSLDEGADHFS